jgi:hypothetical protein
MILFKATLKYYLGKLVKPLLIFLPLNLLAGLLYSILTKNMSIVSYSNTLTVIGGIYMVIGGLGFMGGMFSEIDYTQNFTRNAGQRNADNATRSSFNIMVLTIGISTMLISFAALAFQ